MVTALAQPLNDQDFPLSVKGSLKQDLLEHFGADHARAREGHEETTGLQQPHCQPVDVLVTPQGVGHCCFRRCKPRRVKDDGIKLLALIAELSQNLESVAFQRLNCPSEPVDGGVLFR